ncbi:MAG: xanthine dehydrogenase family protein subunit M, partial [bacterium]
MFPVTIASPENLKELWKILPGIPRPRKYLAGGTDIVVQAHGGSGLPCSWIDISRMPELRRIRETKDSLFIGAGVKIAELECSPAVRRWLPVLFSAASRYASPPLRNMATLGGNCANASPAADGVCALCAEGAEMELASPRKKRILPVEKFFSDYRKTALRPDELILGFKFEKKQHGGAYLKLSPRRAFSISKVSAGVSLRVEKGLISGCRIFMGAVGPVVARAAGTESFLNGRPLSPAVIEEAGELIGRECRPVTDHRSTKEYRCAMTAVLLKRALSAICDGGNKRFEFFS